MSTDLLPLTVHIDAAESITNAPWYVIIDTTKIKEELQECMEKKELVNIRDIDNDDIEEILLYLVRGPFFSFASAEKALPLVKHYCYMGNDAKIYCLSGCPNPEYEKAYHQALKKHGEVPA